MLMKQHELHHRCLGALCKNLLFVHLLSILCFGAVLRKNKKKIDKIKQVILAVKPERFRGDIEVLNEFQTSKL